MVEEFGSVRKRKKLRVTQSKSKVMKCLRMVDGRRMNVDPNQELLEKVQCFKYLGSHVAVDGGIEGEMKFRMSEVGEVCGGMKSVFMCISLGLNAKRRLYRDLAASRRYSEAPISSQEERNLSSVYGPRMWLRVGSVL